VQKPSASPMRGQEMPEVPAGPAGFPPAPDRHRSRRHSVWRPRVRLLFLGDIVGRAGRDAGNRTLPGLREKLRLDLVVVNAENASHGFGWRRRWRARCSWRARMCRRLAITPGIARKSSPDIETEPRLISPAELPAGYAGEGRGGGGAGRWQARLGAAGHGAAIHGTFG
jgi:hypothetical protein